MEGCTVFLTLFPSHDRERISDSASSYSTSRDDFFLAPLNRRTAMIDLTLLQDARREAAEMNCLWAPGFLKRGGKGRRSKVSEREETPTLEFQVDPARQDVTSRDNNGSMAIRYQCTQPTDLQEELWATTSPYPSAVPKTILASPLTIMRP